jgi:uncharacterized repeat protein (TIGR04138 family)
MPTKRTKKSLQEVVDAVGVYPQEAFVFVQEGLTYTVEKIHGDIIDPDINHHVGGRELCLGLREFALNRWGLLAATVLARWNITRTMDFGRIVFAMVQHDLLQKTNEDNPEDFRGVYEFGTAFEASYHIGAPAETGLSRSGQKS